MVIQKKHLKLRVKNIKCVIGFDTGRKGTEREKKIAGIGKRQGSREMQELKSARAG